MSWIQKLYNTYENIENKEIAMKGAILLPVSHTLQQAHIEVVIDGEGNFLRAKVIPKEETILPATESSAGRAGSNPVPHPLADRIRYCAKDYPDFGGEKKHFFESYINQLADWYNSPYCHPAIKAIYTYLNKGHLTFDLVAYKILWVDSSKKLLTSWDKKEDKPEIFKYIKDQGDPLVRWQVEIPGVNPSTWQDKSLFDSWIKYITSKENEKGICYVTGEEKNLAKQHPRGIRYAGDGAKIISSNDNSNYTFRGRFTNSSQACEIGSEVTQKAHSALRWLITRQGYKNSDQVFVAWAVSGKKIPDAFINTFELFEQESSFSENYDLASSQVNKTTQIYSLSGDIGQTFSLKLNKLIAGYSIELTASENIVIVGLDAATPGRMAIVYYQELAGSEFLEYIKKWHSDFSWGLRFTVQDASKNKIKNTPKHKTVWRASAPSPKDIAEAAFGKNLDDKLKKATVQRLLPCIAENRQIPLDLVKSTIRRATNCVGLEYWEWEKNLGIACALFKGYFSRHPNINQRRNYNMSLEIERNSRDYLYGRLLGLAEHIEECALRIAGEKT